MHKNPQLPSRRMFLQTMASASMAAWPAVGLAAVGSESPPGTDAAEQGLKLLFSDSQDVADTWGKLHFGATPMQKLRDGANPGFSIAYALPRANGEWEVYGQNFTRGKPASMFVEQHTWKLIRATTRDGLQFTNVETVCEGEPGPWTDHIAIAYNPDAREFLMLKLKIEQCGCGYRAYFSSDGRNWKEHDANPLFHDGDSMGLFWSPQIRRFVCTNKTLQPYPKRFQDHGGKHPQNKNDDLRDRRVLAIRSSVDGRRWEPSDSMMDIWNKLGTYQPLPAKFMTVPDADDPPEMEFYRGIGFWYHDRSYMVVLNYAASPLMPHKHGPQLDTEWWVSHDGLKWGRPYRGINAMGDAFQRLSYCITHNPLVIDGMLLFQFGNQLYGMKQDRISYVASRANAEFSSVPFVMPQADLVLNAAIPSPERSFAAAQAYVRVAIADEKGNIIPGWEAEHCLHRNQDDIALPLRWNGRSAQELAGRRIRLRFQMRSANVYAVTSQQRPR